MNEVYSLETVIRYLSALILPGLLVLLFTRVTYNRVIGLILTVALIATSVYKGYTNTFVLIVVDAFSLTAGFWMAEKMKQRAINKS
ncbi:CsbA family protein [Bacillus sp. ISL-40]|jgi:general stress protein CsbA|uniref:CsbA family protein n=1 Tax=Priestia megaterium TaxID=1404 RepID=A0A6H1PAJ6_PRIMG|nr:CsbA family protein [Bacillus sp. ISL-77]MBT2698148.1 CsbA family protein [Bacillus sp. ISL-40]MBT2742030.1 CsbA family protein [Bacillus sp. ISL-77]QIZ10558.1 CsbA family protein [Priestia megaterium]